MCSRRLWRDFWRRESERRRMVRDDKNCITEKYYLFGAGNNAWGVIAYFGKENIIAIIDNEAKKTNSFMRDIPIISLEQYLQSHSDGTIIITAAVHEGIEEQLSDHSITDYYVAPMIQMGLASAKQMIAEWHMTQMEEIFLFGYQPIGRHLICELHRCSANCRVKVIPQSAKEAEWAKKDDLHIADVSDINEDSNVIIFQSGDVDKVKTIKRTSEGIFNIFDLVMESNKGAAGLIKWKNIHEGESCILVGNGPSLRMEDLEKIHHSGIASFGMNLIYKVYDNTVWRPAYYIFSDYNMMRQYYDEIALLRRDNLFVKNFYYMEETPVLSDANYYPGCAERCYLDEQRFAVDITKAVYGGYTVMYDALQIAIYMGYKKIYLIGTDFSYLDDPATKGNHFYDDKTDDKRVIAGKPHIYISLAAMRKAEAYAREHNIDIYNATRGGKLEVFRRIDLDSLI